MMSPVSPHRNRCPPSWRPALWSFFLSPLRSFALVFFTAFECKWDSDTSCVLCGELLDRLCDHALSCCGGGDRVLWHNSVWDVLCGAVSQFTSVFLEPKKPGLLLRPRPPDPGGTGAGSDTAIDASDGRADPAPPLFLLRLKRVNGTSKTRLVRSCLVDCW